MKKLLSILFVITTLLSFGQDTLKEVQIVSVRADQSTPVTQKTIKKVDIQREYTGQDMSYILSKTPSITANSDNGLYNSYTYFRIRGIDQTRINMTLNGIPLNEPEDQGVYFSNYPDFGSNLNSVQIQRGIGTSSYGSSSYGGSINFEGPNLTDSNYTSLETGYGSYNTYRNSVGYNSGIKNKFAVYGRYSMIGSDGYRYNSFNDSRTFFASAGYYGDKNILKLTAFSGQSNNGMAYLATNIEDIKVDPRTNYLTKEEQDKFNQHLISLQWISNIDKNSYLNTSIFYNSLDGNYDILFPDTITSTNDMYKFKLKSNFYGIMSTFNYSKDRVKFQFGINTSSYDRTHMMSNYPNFGTNLYNNTGYKTEISSFMKLHYNLTKKLVSFIDLQYRSVTFIYASGDTSNKNRLDNIDYTFFNPKGGFRFNQNDNLSIYTSIGVNHREPTRNDLFNGYDDVSPINKYQYVGFGVDTIDIRNIKSEKVADFEIGVSYKSKKLSVDLNGYYMDFKNEIAQIGQMSYIGLPLRKNVKSSFRSGVEFDLLWTPIKGFVFSQNVNYSYNKIKEYTTDFDSITYKNVSPLLTPNIISNTSMSYSYKYITIGVNGRYVSKSYLDNTQNDKFVTPEFYLLDIFTQVNIKNVCFKLTVNNLTSQKYYTSGYVGFNGNGPTSSYYVGSPRNYYVSLSYKF